MPFAGRSQRADVGLIECGSDICNHLLTSCKALALRDRLFKENVQSELVLWRGPPDCRSSLFAGRHTKGLFVPPSCVKRRPLAYKFTIVGTQSIKVSFATMLQSINIGDNLPPLFKPFVRWTLNPLLSDHIPCNTHTQFTTNTVYQHCFHGWRYIS